MWYPSFRLLSGLRGRLALSYAIVVLLSVAGSAAYTTASLRGYMLDFIGEDLLTRAALIADDLRGPLSRADADAVKAHIARLDELTSVRFLVLDGSGRPIAATVNPPPIEVQATVSTTVDSATPNERVQATVPVRGADGAVIGVIRASFTVAQVRAVTDRVYQTAVFGAFLAGVMAALAGLALAASVAHPVREVARAAGRLAGGRSPVPIPAPRGAPNEVRSLVASFNELAAQMAAFERARVEFASDVAHEVRSLGSAMRTAAEALEAGALRDDPRLGQRLVHGLVGHTRRLSRLADDLLGLSRLEGGRLQLDLRELDVREPVSSAVDELLAEAEQRGVVLTLEVPDGPLAVRADAVRLVQAVGNLIDNALKYAGHGGRVDVRVRRAEGAIDIAVEDSGPGISEEMRGRIFERYVRLDERNTAGTGLGLAIASGIARAHDGHLRVEASATGGARFVLRIPAIGTLPSPGAPAAADVA
jgi:signal transduction histidine kinase